MTPVDPTMDADTQARCLASDVNAAGIIRGRRAAALGLLATDDTPAQEVRKGWEPIRQAKDGDDAYRVKASPPVTIPPAV